MKHLIFALTLLFSLTNVQAQNTNPDAIVGKWNTEEDKGVIEIYKWSSKYYGRILTVAEPNGKDGKPLVDAKNPNEKLRNRPIIKLEILKDFKYNGDNLWTEGKIYDPETGNSYSCKITLIDKNTIEVRGFMGVALIGRTTTWKRKLN